MPRYVFTPLPIRLPLSAIAALAEAMAALDDRRPTRRARTIRLALAFRVAPETVGHPFCPIMGLPTLHS